MAGSLAGKTAIVTGGGGGVGGALVRLLKGEGARVVAVDIAEDRLTDSEADVKVGADVASPADADRIFEAAGGEVDILVNNAGLIEIQTVEDISDELWHRVHGVNLHGPFMLCKRAVPIMVERGGGRIVNVSSVSGLRGGRAGVAYSASKFGLIGLTMNVAVTYADAGIRCNAICPGGIQTNFPQGAPVSERAAKVARSNPFVEREQYATPEQIASVALFLCKPESSHVNGIAIPVDNGWLAI